MTSSIDPPQSAKRTRCAIRIAKMQMRLLREGILTAEQINELEHAAEHEAAEAADKALEAPLPEVSINRTSCLLRRSGSDASGICHRDGGARGKSSGEVSQLKGRTLLIPWRT